MVARALTTAEPQSAPRTQQPSDHTFQFDDSNQQLESVESAYFRRDSASPDIGQGYCVEACARCRACSFVFVVSAVIRKPAAALDYDGHDQVDSEPEADLELI